MTIYSSRRGPKKLRVFEAFSGIGAQRAALERLKQEYGFNYEVVGTSDWFINAIIAYDAIHCSHMKKPEMPSREEHIKYLKQFQFSLESVRPLKKVEFLPDELRERLFVANKRTKNLGSITDVKGEEFPDCDLGRRRQIRQRLNHLWWLI